jgi:hypothetical protein
LHRGLVVMRSLHRGLVVMRSFTYPRPPNRSTNSAYIRMRGNGGAGGRPLGKKDTKTRTRKTRKCETVAVGTNRRGCVVWGGGKRVQVWS